jgi:hypothetical protein
VSADKQSVFRGWWRPTGGRWRELAAGDSYDAALDALLDAMQRGRLSGGAVVLRAGETPGRQAGEKKQ